MIIFVREESDFFATKTTQDLAGASPGICTLPMVPCSSSPVPRFALASAMQKTKHLRRRLSTGRFRGNSNFSNRKSLGRKQRSRQNINVKQQTKFAAATSVANSVRC